MTADQNGDGANRAPLQAGGERYEQARTSRQSVENYNKFVLDQVKRARTDRNHWVAICLDVGTIQKRKSRLRAHRPECRCRVSRYLRYEPGEDCAFHFR